MKFSLNLILFLLIKVKISNRLFLKYSIPKNIIATNIIDPKCYMNKIYKVKSAGVLEHVTSDIPKPFENEVVIEHKAIGVNHIDYKIFKGEDELGFFPGVEAAGIVHDVGEKVEGVKKGDKVAYATNTYGAYSIYNKVDSQNIIPIPNKMPFEMAALTLRKGMTAHYLMRRAFYVRPGMWVLIQGASGGLGSFMIRLAQHYKAQIIGTAGNDQKCNALENMGGASVFNYNSDYLSEVLDITKQEGVSVVYDLIGKSTFETSVELVGKFGLACLVGDTSGKVENFNINALNKNSIFVTMPNIDEYKKERVELLLSSHEVFDLIKKGVFPRKPSKVYKFEEVPQVFEDFKNKCNLGASVINV